MKRRLYPVVKYGSRLAIAIGIVPLAIVVMAAVIGSVFRFDSFGFMLSVCDFLLLVLLPLLIFASGLFAVVGVSLIYRYGSQIRRQAANQASLKLQADGSAQLLPAAGPGTIAGGSIGP
jgi:hypothetical protein